MTLYFLGMWALVLTVLGLALYIAIRRLPGFTMKRDLNNLEAGPKEKQEEEPSEAHLKLKRDVEFSSELRLEHESHEIPENHEIPERYKNPETHEIPWGYGDNKLVLMTKDPYWLFTYWEITDERKNEIKWEYGEHIFADSHPTLRVYDRTTTETNYFDIKINDYARNWYINVEHPGHSYQVAIGRKLHDGMFVTLLESNVTPTPKERMSNEIDEKWPPIPGIAKYYDKFNYNEVLSSPDSARKD